MNQLDLVKLTTEKRNPETMNLDEMSIEDILCVMNREDEKVVKAVKAVLPKVAEIIGFTTKSLKNSGRIIYIGAGTSGRLGVLDAVECPPTFGVSDEVVVGVIAGGEKAFVKAAEGAEDSPELGEKDLKALKVDGTDTVIGLTASGRTPYVIGALKYASQAGCATASISCNSGSKVSTYADVAVEVDTGPEVLSGSTRLKAGTAEKMILNMISTVSMVETGKVYKNLMVDVRQTNEKLAVRAENIVMQAAGCSGEEARRALAEAGGEAKPAILSLLLNLDMKETRSLLEETNGKIRNSISLYKCEGRH